MLPKTLPPTLIRSCAFSSTTAEPNAASIRQPVKMLTSGPYRGCRGPEFGTIRQISCGYGTRGLQPSNANFAANPQAVMAANWEQQKRSLTFGVGSCGWRRNG